MPRTQKSDIVRGDKPYERKSFFPIRTVFRSSSSYPRWYDLMPQRRWRCRGVHGGAMDEVPWPWAMWRRLSLTLGMFVGFSCGKAMYLVSYAHLPFAPVNDGAWQESRSRRASTLAKLVSLGANMATDSCGTSVRVEAHACPAERDSRTVWGRSEERGSSCWVRGSALGQGSFGRVDHALDRRSCAVFAVKTVAILPEAVCGPGSSSACASMAELRALENEISILKRLGSSPHVVRYLGDDWTHGQDGSTERNLFLELANGGSVADFSKRFGRKLDESMIRRCCRGILRGLQHAHSRGVVHRDVKGQNVLLMVDEEGGVTAKLSDFGASCCVCGDPGDDVDGPSQDSSAAKATEPQEEGGDCPGRSVDLAGTVQWMAPEVASQSGTLSAACDIWSLGCTVIEMATSRAPWSDVGDTMSTLFRIACTNDVPAFPPHVSLEAKDFLSKCLVREPSGRWSASELLEHPFLKDAGYEACACSRRRRSCVSAVEGKAHPVRPRARADRARRAEGLISLPLGGGKKTALGYDAVRGGGEMCGRSEREGSTSVCRLLDAQEEEEEEEEASPRLVFDLPTSSVSELSMVAAKCAGLVAAPFGERNQSSCPDVHVDGLEWDSGHGVDKGVGEIAVILSLLIERQDGEAPVEGHLWRHCDPATAEEDLSLNQEALSRCQRPLADECSSSHSLLRRSSITEMHGDVCDRSGAGVEDTAPMEKAALYRYLRFAVLLAMLPRNEKGIVQRLSLDLNSSSSCLQMVTEDA
ncbi:hypothetical protein CBR_g36773 [Chara braunii]|uniref:Protein kinase domain-containing protein n=1 Tax=Chara braunii TaxID=69332 RepID=A0A388LLI6_CHABU|nr:hypothetical protein CBR_g36773 [Chara braunii]|eukprot:GBG83157.1 hypothetical protein CBR_g36773 [Chara braunii]